MKTARNLTRKRCDLIEPALHFLFHKAFDLIQFCPSQDTVTKFLRKQGRQASSLCNGLIGKLPLHTKNCMRPKLYHE